MTRRSSKHNDNGFEKNVTSQFIEEFKEFKINMQQRDDEKEKRRWEKERQDEEIESQNERNKNNKPSTQHDTQRENIFYTRCKIFENTCSLIMDSESYCNFCSTKMVEKLNLAMLPHPKPYKLHFLNDNRDITSKNQVKVQFSIGNYKDEVLCDILPMEVCHILLGRP